MNAVSTALPVVSKADFARLKGVSSARVAQWLNEGKISREALVGEGRNARINVPVADAQLNRRLDISQRLGNGLATRLGPVAPLPIVPDNPALSDQIPDAIEEKIKREKLEGLQRENRRRAEEEAARAGRYVDSETTQAQMARIAEQTMTIIEGGLPEIAATAAAKFNVPARDMLHLLRHEVRAVRSRAVTSLKEQELALPETIEVEIDPVTALVDTD